MLVGAHDQRAVDVDGDGWSDMPGFRRVEVRHTYTPSDWLSTQINGRCDASSVYGTICSPRLSVLAHSGRALSARLSGGAGWAAPQAQTEETEVFGLTRVVGPLHVSAERARSASLDVSATREALGLSGALFASRVKDPVGLRRLTDDMAGLVEFVNAAGPARVHGAERFAVYNREPIRTGQSRPRMSRSGCSRHDSSGGPTYTSISRTSPT